MTVLLMRILPAPMAALTLGSVGLACILIGYALVAAAGSEDTDSRPGTDEPQTATAECTGTAADRAWHLRRLPYIMTKRRI